MGQEENIKIYFEQQKLIDFDPSIYGSKYEVETFTFMSRWVWFFRFFQVFYLIAVMIAFLIMTGITFFDKVGLNGDELYQ